MYQNALNSADYPALYQVWMNKIFFQFKILFNKMISHNIIFSIAKWKRDRFTEESKNKRKILKRGCTWIKESAIQNVGLPQKRLLF